VIFSQVLDLLVFICACIAFGGGAGGWVRFVSISAFITTLIYFLLHFLNIIARLGQINYMIVSTATLNVEKIACAYLAV
jgi:hypothetical protein